MSTANENVLIRNTSRALALADGLTFLRSGVNALGLAGAGLHDDDDMISNAMVWVANRLEADLVPIEAAAEAARSGDLPVDVGPAMATLREGIHAAFLAAEGLYPSGRGETPASHALTWLSNKLAGDLEGLVQKLRESGAQGDE